MKTTTNVHAQKKLMKIKIYQNVQHAIKLANSVKVQLREIVKNVQIKNNMYLLKGIAIKNNNKISQIQRKKKNKNFTIKRIGIRNQS